MKDKKQKSHTQEKKSFNAVNPKGQKKGGKKTDKSTKSKIKAPTASNKGTPISFKKKAKKQILENFLKVESKAKQSAEHILKSTKKPKVKSTSPELPIVLPPVLTSSGKNQRALKVRFLGGVGEIGKNMTVLEYGKDIIVIDAGLTFPGENMPGVDLVIPDVGFLEQNKSRIRGIVITHGHEDHIGALPYIIEQLGAPIYGTKLTLTLIENKFKERKINNAKLNCVNAGSTIKLGAFSIEFINVNHSIAGAVGLSITTPVGVVFHSGDFKIDFTPVAGETMDLARISEIGKKGVLLLMADSTNIEIEGSTMSEAVVKDTLDHVFSANTGRRLIIATFASNVHRLSQILDLAKKHKRKVAFSGRSMINIAEAASKIGELNIPENLIVDVEKLKNFRDDEIVIVSTGTQGEPMSALTRMASGEFNKVTIGSNDTVVISASVIPGNEKMIYGVINNLYRLGAEVIYESLEPIHVSGHACKGELRVLHSLLKPKFFIPVHGEYRHLKKHTQLAESLGMKAGSTYIADIGDSVEFTSNKMRVIEKVQAGSKFVDGIGVDGADSFVLRDRIHLSEDGIIVAVVGVDQLSAYLMTVEIIAKGLSLDESMLENTKTQVFSALEKVDLKAITDENELSSIIRRAIKNYVFKATKKNPMILPVVMRV